MKRIISLVIMVMGLATVVPAYGDPGPFPQDPELFALKEEVMSLALLRELDLSSEQRSSIRDILTPIHSELTAARERLLAWQRDVMKPHLEELIADLKAGRDTVPQSQETLDRLAELRRTRMDMEIQVEAAYKRILNVLAPQQAGRLANFRPMDAFGLPASPFSRSGAMREPFEILDEIRTAPDARFEKLVDGLTARMEAPPRRKGPFAEERREIRKERLQTLIDLMREIRAMSDEEYGQKLDSLRSRLDGLLPGRGPGRRDGGNDLEDGPGMRPGSGGAGFEPNRRHRDELGGAPMHQRIVFSDAFYQAL